MSYLPKNASTLEEVYQYYRVRCIEMGANLQYIEKQPDGCFLATIIFEDERYSSVYIPSDLRGKGLIKNYLDHRFITIEDCGISDTLEHLGVSYLKLTGWFDSPIYLELIRKVGDSRTNNEFDMLFITTHASVLYKEYQDLEIVEAYLALINHMI